jgi:hypothetical protein
MCDQVNQDLHTINDNAKSKYKIQESLRLHCDEKDVVITKAVVIKCLNDTWFQSFKTEDGMEKSWIA